MPYLKKSKKSDGIKKSIEEAISILEAVGIPVHDKTERYLEKMGMAFMAVGGVVNDWTTAQGYEDRRFLKTREIITYINTHFEENISPGSYDDIRRKDLKLPNFAGLIIGSAANPNAATNDPTRAYVIEPGFHRLIKTFNTDDWDKELKTYMEGKITLREQLARERNIEKVPVTLPDGKTLVLTAGQHNLLQKYIIEEFLPRFGHSSLVLYVGDTSNKMLHIEEDTLKALSFFELSHEELPDVISFATDKNWLYLIEAVHSTGPISEIRRLELDILTKECTAEIIYVTAFLTRADFKKWSSSIAWETEVWIAENPSHLIHFNGDKFLGPYNADKP